MFMKITKIILAPFLLTLALNISHAVVITDFDTGFSVIEDYTSFPTVDTSTPAQITVDGSDNGDSLAVALTTPIDISDLTEITLTGFVNGVNPNTSFFVYLFNTDLTQSRLYSGDLSAFENLSSSLTLTFVEESTLFSDIGGFQFVGTGSGSPLNFTFQSLTASAAPEPSTWVLVASGLLIGSIMLRRKRQSL